MKEVDSIFLLNQYVLIKDVPDQEQVFENTRIVFEQNKRAGVIRGEVISSSATLIERGDIIFYDPRSKQEIMLDGEEYFLVHLNSIYCFKKKEGGNNDD